jgi:hypothetical protein
MQLVALPRQVAHLKSQTWQTPLLAKVPSLQVWTQLWLTAEVCRYPWPFWQLVQKEGWFMQVWQGALQGTQFQLPVELSPMVPAGQTE